MKITHLTSVHSRYDTRIFIKMCCSLASNSNYCVSLIVADGMGAEKKNNVKIFDVGLEVGGRLSRMTKTVKKVYNKAKELDSDIYHLHDPELIPIGIKLKKLGKKVIFDAHEDLPKQVLAKPYLPKPVLVVISKFCELYEKYACKKLDYIVTATPFIRDKFLKINKNSVDINNFPILKEFSNNVVWDDKLNEVCYVGGISEVRGIKELIKSLDFTKNIKLNLAGMFNNKDVEREVKSYKSWEKVNELGFLNRKQIADVYKSSKAGIVTLHPIINYLDALPVKMFEYMLAGLPVIASDIVLWKDIVEGNNCGICVNPLEPEQIAKSIQYLISNPEIANKMGENGKKAVLDKYNWNIEEVKLFNLYQKLVDSDKV